MKQRYGSRAPRIAGLVLIVLCMQVLVTSWAPVALAMKASVGADRLATGAYSNRDYAGICEWSRQQMAGDAGQEMQTVEFIDQLLQAELEQLVEQYGIVATGEEEYAIDYSEDVIPAERLTGLLGADICDYDGDGQPELMTLRLDTSSTGSNQSDGTRCVISAYDWNAGSAQVELADELTFDMYMTNAWANSAIHFARGESDQGVALYAEYYYELNSRGFGTLRIEYDGALNLIGGVECDEFYAWLSCYEAVSDEALQNLLSPQLALDGGGWEQRANYNWEEQTAEPAPEYLDDYSNCYRELMAQLNLEEPNPRSQWIDPDRPALDKYDPEQADKYQQEYDELMRYNRELVMRHTDERCLAIDGTLTALCGVSKCALDSYNVALECYDAGEWLSSFR